MATARVNVLQYVPLLVQDAALWDVADVRPPVQDAVAALAVRLAILVALLIVVDAGVVAEIVIDV